MANEWISAAKVSREQRLSELLKKSPQGLTYREIYERTGWSLRSVYEIVQKMTQRQCVRLGERGTNTKGTQIKRFVYAQDIKNKPPQLKVNARRDLAASWF